MTVIEIFLAIGLSLIGGGAAATIHKCYLTNKRLIESKLSLERANAQLQAEAKRQIDQYEKEYRQVYIEKLRAEISRDKAKIKVYDFKQRLRDREAQLLDLQVHKNRMDPLPEKRGVDLSLSPETNSENETSAITETEEIIQICANTPMEVYHFDPLVVSTVLDFPISYLLELTKVSFTLWLGVTFLRTNPYIRVQMSLLKSRIQSTLAMIGIGVLRFTVRAYAVLIRIKVPSRIVIIRIKVPSRIVIMWGGSI